MQRLAYQGLARPLVLATIRPARAEDGAQSGPQARSRATEPTTVLSGAADTVTLSLEAQAALEATEAAEPEPGAQPPSTPDGPDELTPDEQEQVEALKQRDAEVRRHEQAHESVGRPYTSAPSYDYQTGPDGRRYAVGGEVQIDASPVDGDPAATIRKMEKVRASALAPAEPSAQDRKVAAKASRTLSEARAELAQAQDEDAPDPSPNAAGDPGLSDLVAQSMAIAPLASSANGRRTYTQAIAAYRAVSP